MCPHSAGILVSTETLHAFNLQFSDMLGMQYTYNSLHHSCNGDKSVLQAPHATHHNMSGYSLCRDPDFDRRNSGALASPSAPSSSPGAGPFDLERMSLQANAQLQAQEEERDQLRIERMHRANRAAAAARAAVKVGLTEVFGSYCTGTRGVLQCDCSTAAQAAVKVSFVEVFWSYWNWNSGGVEV